MARTVSIRPVRADEIQVLKALAEQTFRETFAHDNHEDQLQAFFDEAYRLDVLAAELADPETEVDFLLVDNEIAGYLKLNWGQAQTEQDLPDGFEIQRIYLLKAYQGQGLGKVLFDYALDVAEASGKTWVWLGVWEKNFKAQAFYQNYGFEKFSEHAFPVGEGKVDVDWLMRKRLKNEPIGSVY